MEAVLLDGLTFSMSKDIMRGVIKIVDRVSYKHYVMNLTKMVQRTTYFIS